jgi:hypothetical protein
MAVAMVGLVMLPACDMGSKKVKAQTLQPYLSPEQESLLAEVVGTIIPGTDTPGAKDLNVHIFVQKMVTDCYEKDVQQNLAKGLDTVEEMARKNHSNAFAACTEPQRIAILTSMEQSDIEEQKAFFDLVKELTIFGYTTSEYVMTNLTEYTMIPGHYYGCVPVPKAA